MFLHKNKMQTFIWNLKKDQILLFFITQIGVYNLEELLG